MRFNCSELIYFSPTKTSRKVAEAIGRGLGVDATTINLTRPGVAEGTKSGGDVAVIVVPVYGGRVPVDAVRRLRRIKADNAPAIIVVVYGNRAYEDALVELSDVARECGFKPVAAGAFIGEHSFSTKEIPLSTGRPDQDDLTRAEAFGAQVKSKLASADVAELFGIDVPGNHPYKEWSGPIDGAPIVDANLCEECGKCALLCPVGAIPEGGGQSDPEKCIFCCACIRFCPVNARSAEAERVLMARKWLAENCAERREPELFV